MAEQRVRDFADRAESLVTIPDFETIERGGDRLRRQRNLLASGVIAAVVAVTATLTANGLHTRADEPVAPPIVTPWPGDASVQPLQAGIYELDVSDKRGAPNVQLTVPDGWDGWYGPVHGTRNAFLGVLVLDVTKVVSTPCKPGSYGMDEVGDGTQALVAALMRIPRHNVMVAPERDDRFGYPGTHLRLQAGRVDCPFGADFELFSTDGGLIQAAGPHVGMDLWVVDVDGYRFLVAASATRNSPDSLKGDLDSVVASIRFVATE
jgi:hypothetical protein